MCTRGRTKHAHAHNYRIFFFITLCVLRQLLRLRTPACLDARTLEVNRAAGVHTPPFETLANFLDADAALARSPVLWHQLTVRWVEREATTCFDSLRKRTL